MNKIATLTLLLLSIHGCASHEPPPAAASTSPLPVAPNCQLIGSIATCQWIERPEAPPPVQGLAL